ncbi:uncharacterized protein C3orf38 homolog [Planococcus citri]|uniref:uncharacterized protein C3orf38 homolog n=1 Tax=Planococcus citri TaxID=170843 RepID=UPI0031F7A9AD
MLNNIEENFIFEFLEDFPEPDLFSIALNITKHNITPSNRQDALKIICLHSTCVETVLEKRKITKSYLSQFLHKNHIPITDSWDKPALIRKVIEHWNIKNPLASIKSESNLDHVQNASSSGNPYNDNIQSQIPDHNSSQEYYYQLARQFSDWYYTLINDENLSNLGPEHFFTDSRMKLELQDRHSTDVTEATNSTDIVQALRDVKLRYNFKFLPNLNPDAIRYNADIHGQVMVMVGGTLHTNASQVVGLFEQMFLLIRDPSDNNNWKVKNSKVMLRSSNAIEQAPAQASSALELYS